MSHVTGGPSGPYAYHPQQQPKRKGLMPLIFGGLTLLVGTPLAFLLLSPVFRNSDASFEEAASICGAGLVATLRHVTLGMARPALLALGLLVFIKASEAFEVPALVGLPGSARVFTSTIYTELTLAIPPNSGMAAAFGVLLLVIMAVLLQVYARIAAQSHRYQTVTGKNFRPRVTRPDYCGLS